MSRGPVGARRCRPAVEAAHGAGAGLVEEAEAVAANAGAARLRHVQRGCHRYGRVRRVAAAAQHAQAGRGGQRLTGRHAAAPAQHRGAPRREVESHCDQAVLPTSFRNNPELYSKKSGRFLSYDTTTEKPSENPNTRKIGRPSKSVLELFGTGSALALHCTCTGGYAHHVPPEVSGSKVDLE